MSDVGTESPAVREMLEGDPELERAWTLSAPCRGVAAALARLRRLRGLSQSELARAAGWDPAFVSRLEAGRAGTPTLETIARYTRLCGGTPTLEIASAEGDPQRIGLSPFAPDVEPAESPLAPARRERQRRMDASRARLGPGIGSWPAGIVELDDRTHAEARGERPIEG